MVKILLADQRVDPSANRNHAIKKAVRLEYNIIVKLLLDYGASYSKYLVDQTGRGREVDRSAVYNEELDNTPSDAFYGCLRRLILGNYNTNIFT
jgi:hypothetical protein